MDKGDAISTEIEFVAKEVSSYERSKKSSIRKN